MRSAHRALPGTPADCVSANGYRFASPWSAPGWMKTTNKTGHGGSLLGKAGDAVHKAWAQYLVKFLEVCSLLIAKLIGG